MSSEKDSEQDRQIRDNAVRIARNEEAIKRQTEALEQIRDHYYPPPARPWKRIFSLLAKVCCAVFAYLGIAQTVDWLWNARESDSLAARYARVGHRLLYEQGDAASAIACFEQAAELDPKESDYVMAISFMKGLVMAAKLLTCDRPLTVAEKAHVDSALAEATVLAELQPKSAMLHVLMAQTLFLRGEKAAAIAAVDRAIALEPENGSVRVSACAISFYAGDVKKARSCLAEAERLDPKLPLINIWKGVLASLVDHDVAAAEGHFRAAIRRTPRLALAHALLGDALLAQGAAHLAEARAAFERALVLNAKLLVAMRGMADTYEHEGNLLVARLWHDRTLGVDANYLPAILARARVDGRLGENDAAVRDLTAAIALAPFRADLYRLRADAYGKSGDAAKAKADRATADALAKTKD